MRGNWRVRAGATVALLMGAGAGPATTPAQVGYVEGVKNAEDLVPLPGTNWIVTGGLGDNMGPGGLFMIDTVRLRAQRLYPTSANRSRHDTKSYPGCPGPISPAGFSAHGIAVRPGPSRKATLFAVNHVGREAVEVFTLDHLRRAPALTWIGCVPLPEGSLGNGVVALPDGGLAMTIMNSPEYFAQPADAKDPKVWIGRLARGETTGHVATWRPGRGWRKLAGTEGSGSNGIEVSPDGRWLYVARWGNREIVRVPLRGGGAVTSVKVDFAPDNLRWGSDGQLWTAGAAGSAADYFACGTKPGCHNDYVVARIEPRTLAVTKIAHPETRPTFADATTALRLGQRVWIGANPSARVAYLRLP